MMRLCRTIKQRAGNTCGSGPPRRLGERRYAWLKRAGRLTAEYAHREWGIGLPVIPDDGYSAAAHELRGIIGLGHTLEECEEALRPADRRGGSHKNDWRCTDSTCRHRNSIKSRACAKCKRPAPLNGRPTRDSLEAKQKEHRIREILKKQI